MYYDYNLFFLWSVGVAFSSRLIVSILSTGKLSLSLESDELELELELSDELSDAIPVSLFRLTPSAINASSGS